MTASQIVKKMDGDELAAVLNDIANEHLDRGCASRRPIPDLVALEERIREESPGMSKGMAMVTAKEAALVEGCNRWLALREACKER
jgi:hypothetical protein